MGKLSAFLYGAGIAAGLMYFYDPQMGDRRRAKVKDQIAGMQNDANDGIQTGVRDLRNRARGIMAEGMAMVSNDQGATDHVVEERIRSRLGFLSRHPGAIQVSVNNKTATLTGDILKDEVDNLAAGVSRVRGVQSVVNNMRVHQEAGNIPQLQGEGWLPGMSEAGNQWAPSQRLLAGAGAGYLFMYGMVRGGLVGTLSQIGGLILGARAITNIGIKRMMGMTDSADAVRVRKAINIDAPVDQVYGLWSNFENFPKFMANIEQIKDMGNGRSHWVVKGPAGTKVEFDAVVTENKPNELIAWETMEDSTVKHRGQVRFKQGMQEGTQVNVNMAYTPPAGVAGHTVASLFGSDPKSEMDADLARMKSLLEEGKTTAGDRTVNRSSVNMGDQNKGASSY